MQKVDIDFLYLLKCFIHNEAPFFDHKPAWDQIKKYAVANAVDGIVGYMVIQHRLWNSSEDREFWINKLTNTYGMGYRRFAQAERLFGVLEQNSIPYLTVKGSVVKDYYPVGELRTFSDIDILIKTEDRQRLHELMLTLGYKATVDGEPIYSYRRDTEFYEIHTEMMYENIKDTFDYRDYFSSMWQKAVYTGGVAYELKPEDHLIYLIAHIAKHIGYAGAGIRMYLDLAAFMIHFSNHFDWDYVFSEMNKIKLLKFTDVVFTAVEEQFGIGPNYAFEHADKELVDKLIMTSIRGGTYGFKNQSSGAVTLKKTGSGENVSKINALRVKLFPSADVLEPRYQYLTDRHWLLPVAWVERWFQTRSQFKKNAAKAKDILLSDKNEIIEMRKFKEDLGL